MSSPKSQLRNRTSAPKRSLSNGETQSSTYLIITLFAQTEIEETVSSATATNFLRTRTLGLEHCTKLSSRVLRLCHLYPPNSPSASILRHDPEVALLEKSYNVEVVLHIHDDKREVLTHLPVKLAIFDMDSTLINQEVIDELAKSIGVTAAVSAITERAMAGELDFEESLKARVKLLKGVRADVWTDLKETVTFTEGAKVLCDELARIGVKMGVLSGGFVPMADWVKGELGLHHAHSNAVSVHYHHSLKMWYISYNSSILYLYCFVRMRSLKQTSCPHLCLSHGPLSAIL